MTTVDRNHTLGSLSDREWVVILCRINHPNALFASFNPFRAQDERESTTVALPIEGKMPTNQRTALFAISKHADVYFSGRITKEQVPEKE